ncbi:MAG: cyclic nucleotide-binding domain-containing protein [Deltaproteobacteria bacterium]|nr:cyclic nucleotide-binding domain-containing protein [Deltaproteobacteria bacterium]
MSSIEAVLARSALFSALSPQAQGTLARALRLKKLATGQVLFRQGEPGDFLGVVAQGSLGVRCLNPSGVEVELARLGEGEVIGEMACLDPGPRSATLVAVTDAVVGTLDRAVLQSMRSGAPDLAVRVVDAIARVLTVRLRETNERIRQATDGPAPRSEPITRRAPASGQPYLKPLELRGVAALAAYDDRELEHLARVAPPLVYQHGDVLCFEGGRADACYLVAGGEVEIVKEHARGPHVLATLGRGTMVGQLALLDDAPRSATVRAKGTTGVLAIRRADFRRLLDAHDTLALKLHEQVTAAGIRQLRLADASVAGLLQAAAPVRSPPAATRPLRAPDAARRGPGAWEGESRPPSRHSVARGERVLRGDYISTALGEWGLSLADLDQVQVVRPDGMMTAAELKARLGN